MLIDINEDLNINLESLYPCINDKTLAVIVIHTGGRYVTDLMKINELSKIKQFEIIEDFCQGTGIKHLKPTSDFSIYSFGLGKHVSATAGGILLAKKFLREINELSQDLGNEESENPIMRYKYTIEELIPYKRDRVKEPVIAFKSSYINHVMSPFDAEIAFYQLGKIDVINQSKKLKIEIIQKYLEEIDDLQLIGSNKEISGKITLLSLNEDITGLKQALSENNIETESLYKPLHIRDIGKQYCNHNLHHSEGVYNKLLNLPDSAFISPKDMAKIGEIILAYKK